MHTLLRVNRRLKHVSRVGDVDVEHCTADVKGLWPMEANSYTLRRLSS
jgi:hypothetical protein